MCKHDYDRESEYYRDIEEAQNAQIEAQKELVAKMVEVKLLEVTGKRGIRTIQELHDLSGLSRTTISNLLNGYAKGIEFETIEKLCRVLDCELQDIIQIKNLPKAATNGKSAKNINDGGILPRYTEVTQNERSCKDGTIQRSFSKF